MLKPLNTGPLPASFGAKRPPEGAALEVAVGLEDSADLDRLNKPPPVL